MHGVDEWFCVLRCGQKDKKGKMKTTAIEKDTTCIGCSGLLDDRMRGFVLDGSGPYCSEECCIDELMNERDRLYDERHNVISLIEQYGGIDGAHHKQWAIDQIARMLVDDYAEWVAHMKRGEYGDCGKASRMPRSAT